LTVVVVGEGCTEDEDRWVMTGHRLCCAAGQVLSGTSMAAPFVTGVLACILSESLGANGRLCFDEESVPIVEYLAKMTNPAVAINTRGTSRTNPGRFLYLDNNADLAVRQC
jgi:subtilisin family serine protease